MPGLGTSYGRGGATTNQMDVRFADAVLIMGSNMAECHPVSFRFVMQAKLNGAKVLHVDPRFTRTSAMADVYAPLRAGTDIVFLGGLIRHVLEENKYFHEYVSAYTNAATLITGEFQDTEDLEGLFSGFNPERKEYDPRSWRYDAEPHKHPRTDPTLQDPRCVFQILRRHYARYTPELVERVCGTPRDTFLKVAEALCNASGPERTGVDLLRRRLDPAHDGRPDHPRGHDPPVAPGQHRPARRRHPRAAGPRLDPGLDRYPHALQPPSRLSQHPQRPQEARHPGRLHRHRDHPDQLLDPLSQVHRQPA